MSHVVSAEKSGHAWDMKETRESTDGKDAKLGYADDDPAPGSIYPPPGETGGDFDLRVSKWNGDGQEARHGKA